MDLRQLEMFLAVVECGSYLKAGERLNVSHSAVHRQIRMLEHELQDRLLARVGRHIKLTETGRIALSLARRIRQEISNAHRQISELNQLQSGHLRLGTGTSILASFLPPILDRFRKEFPNVEVHVITGTADQIIEEIHSDNLDLGIVFSPLQVSKGEHIPAYELLYKEELVLAVGKGHPLAKRKAIPLAQLQGFSINMYTKTSHIRRSIQHVFEKAGITPRISMELDNEEAMRR